MDPKELALKIRALRKVASLSQEELAARSGVARRVVQRIEKAEGSPTLASLNAILRVLDTEFGTKEKAVPRDPLPEWANQVSQRLAALEIEAKHSGTLKSPQTPYEVTPEDQHYWQAWQNAAEQWQRDVALFFLTGNAEEITDAVPKALRERLMTGLKGYKMMPTSKGRAPKK